MDTQPNGERGRLLVRFCSATNKFEEHLACFIDKKSAEFCSYNKEYIKTVCKVSDSICSTCDVTKWSQTSEGSSDARERREVCNLCQALYDRITDKHALKSPNWANVKWQFILIEPLQHMKCYIKEHGHRESGLVRDLGLLALVQICSNHRDLNTLFGSVLPFLEKIAENCDQIYQSETLHICEDDLTTHLRKIEDVFKIVCGGVDMDIRSPTISEKIFNGGKEQFTREDELNTLFNIIQTLDRRIHSLKCWQTISGNIQDDPELQKLLFIKQVHCHKLQKHKQVLKNYTDKINKLCDDDSSQYCASGTVIVQSPHDKYNQTLREKTYDNVIEALENTNTNKKGIEMVIDLLIGVDNKLDACHAGKFLVPGTSKEDGLRTVGQTESQSDLDSREIIRHTDRPMETEASTTTEARLIQSPTGKNTMGPLLCQKKSLKRPYQCLEIERSMVTVTPAVQPIRTEQSLTESPNSLNSRETIPEHISLLERPLQYLEEGGNTICRVNHECMALYIRCTNMTNVITLCEDVLNGKVEALFQPLQEYLRTQPDCNNVSVVVNISENDFTKCIMPCLIKLNRQLDSRIQQLELPYNETTTGSTAAGHAGMSTAISILKNMIAKHPSVNCETPSELRLTVDTLGVEDSHTLTRHLVDAANELQRRKNIARTPYVEKYRETSQPPVQIKKNGIETAIAILKKIKGQIPFIEGTSELRLKVEAIGVKDGHSLTRQIFDAAIELQSTEETKTSNAQELREFLQHVFQYLKQGGNALSIRETDCSAFYIRCPTLANAMTLCEDFLTGKVEALFQPLQGYLRTLPECQDVSMVVDISENDFAHCIFPSLTKIKRHLDSCVPAPGLDSVGSVTDENNPPVASRSFMVEHYDGSSMQCETLFPTTSGNALPTTIQSDFMNNCEPRLNMPRLDLARDDKSTEKPLRSGNHSTDKNYQHYQSYGTCYSVETNSCSTVEFPDNVVKLDVLTGIAGAYGSALRTSKTTGADDAMSYDAGESNADIDFDISKWKDDISDITANEDEVKRFLSELTQSSPSRIRDLYRRTRDDLARWQTETLHIAVTGNSGVGKSSFINAIRGLAPGDAGWAQGDVIGETMKPTQYNHPVSPNIIFWDLPGVGTKSFTRETYMDNDEFERYDFYIIICAGRFTKNDLWLAEAIHLNSKTYIFVRTKVQQDIDNARRVFDNARRVIDNARRVFSGESDFDQNFVLRNMRRNCLDSLPKSLRGEVYLIDNDEPQLYDFGKLALAIINHSPPEKRQLATFGMCLLTEDVIKAKEEELKKRLWKTALMVAVTDASPIDVFGIRSTDEYVIIALQFYREQLGLTDTHLYKYALAEGKTKQEYVECNQLKSTILSNREQRLKLMNILNTASTKVNSCLAPVVTALASGATSFGTSMKFLWMALELAGEDIRKINKITRRESNDPHSVDENCQSTSAFDRDAKNSSAEHHHELLIPDIVASELPCCTRWTDQPTSCDLNSIQAELRFGCKRSKMSDPEGSQPSVGGGGDGIEPTASEVARDLQIIAKNIKDEKIQKELQNVISKIAHGSVQERSYNILTENVRSFVTNLGSSVHFSLSQTKQIIKIIIVLWNKPFIAKHVMKEVYNEDIGDETEVPKDVKNMNEKAIEIYSKALKDGVEEIPNIRVMVLGMFGVGKTSLIKDFRDKKIVPLSTEGIDLHKCQLMENGDWCLDNGHALTKYQSRFKKGFKDISISTLSTMSVHDETFLLIKVIQGRWT